MRNQDKFPNGRNRDDNILTKRSIGHSGTHIYCYVHTAQTEAKWKKNEIVYKHYAENWSVAKP